MAFKGDHLPGAKVTLGWTSNNSNGAAATASLGTVVVYRYDQQSASVATTCVGVSANTVTVDAIVGYNRVIVDSSLSVAWYLPHCDYEAVGSGFSVDGQFVNLVVGSFSLNNRYQPFLLSRSTVSGAASTTINLNLNESSLTDLLIGGQVVISQRSQSRGFTAYGGTSRQGTVDRSFASTPVAGDRYDLYMGSLPLSGGELADSVLTRNIATASDGGRNVSSALMPLRNKVTTGGSTLTVFSTDDSTSAWTASITTAGSALASLDPA